MSDQGFTYGTAQDLTANACTRTGYTFAGWATSENGNVVYDDKESVNNLTTTNGGTVNLWAKWMANTYTVTFEIEGGNGGSESATATYDAAMPAITVPTKTGYTFGGYYTETNGGGTQYYKADGTSAKSWNIAEATKLYAKWTANAYFITYHGNGATSGSMLSHTRRRRTRKWRRSSARRATPASRPSPSAFRSGRWNSSASCPSRKMSRST